MLHEVAVRPVRDAQERRRWDALVAEFHHLPFHGLFGQSLRHLAVRGSDRVALAGWTAGAFKVGARGRWIGWPPARQFRHLGLIASNSRFVVLAGKREARNPASRVLGLSLRRLSRDLRAAPGHPVPVAETFVAPSRFAGACCRASNWRLPGVARGFTRLPGGAPGRAGAGRVGACREGDAAAGAATARPAHFLEAMPGFRKARGRRYSLACHLTIMIAARLAGYRGVAAFGEFAARLDDGPREAAGGFFSPTRRRHTVPAAPTFHYILSALLPDTLDEALRAWRRQHGGRSRRCHGRQGRA